MEDEEIRELAEKWIKWDKNQETCLQVTKMLESRDFKSLSTLMSPRLKFGTAGLRGRMGPGFSQMNDLVMVQTSSGLLAYLQANEKRLSEKGLVIGWDGRHNSRRWANLTAGLFLRQGVRVYMFSSTVPTPLVPFTVLARGAAAGVMVTASHNPRWDNGYKVYWGNGAQILAPHDSGIQRAIEENLEPGEGAFTEIQDHPLLSDPLEEMTSLYLESLNLLNPKNLNCSLKSSVVYTAMHGVGYSLVHKAWLHAGFPSSKLLVVEEQRDPHPDFPTVDFPNPEEGASALDLSYKLCKSGGAKYILANDPDADRLGVAEVDEGGHMRVLTGNEIGALLGWWVLQSWKKRNPGKSMEKVNFLASTVSSKLLGAMARIEGFKFTETLTGFKHMGNVSDRLLREGEEVLFAFEEAIGFMVGTGVLDKDGVSALVCLSELIAELDSRGSKLSQQLVEIYKMYGFHCSQTSYFICHDQKLIKRVFEKLRNWEGTEKTYPRTVCDGRYRVTGIRDLTTGYDSRTVSLVAELPSSPSSQMVTAWLDCGVSITLRTSGTEPKVKYYAELVGGPETVESEWNSLRERLDEVVRGVLGEWCKGLPN